MSPNTHTHKLAPGATLPTGSIPPSTENATTFTSAGGETTHSHHVTPTTDTSLSSTNRDVLHPASNAPPSFWNPFPPVVYNASMQSMSILDPGWAHTFNPPLPRYDPNANFEQWGAPTYASGHPSLIRIPRLGYDSGRASSGLGVPQENGLGIGMTDSNSVNLRSMDRYLLSTPATQQVGTLAPFSDFLSTSSLQQPVPSFVGNNGLPVIDPGMARQISQYPVHQCERPIAFRPRHLPPQQNPPVTFPSSSSTLPLPVVRSQSHSRAPMLYPSRPELPIQASSSRILAPSIQTSTIFCVDTRDANGRDQPPGSSLEPQCFTWQLPIAPTPLFPPPPQTGGSQNLEESHDELPSGTQSNAISNLKKGKGKAPAQRTRNSHRTNPCSSEQEKSRAKDKAPAKKRAKGEAQTPAEMGMIPVDPLPPLGQLFDGILHLEVTRLGHPWLFCSPLTISSEHDDPDTRWCPVFYPEDFERIQRWEWLVNPPKPRRGRPKKGTSHLSLHKDLKPRNEKVRCPCGRVFERKGVEYHRRLRNDGTYRCILLEMHRFVEADPNDYRIRRVYREYRDPCLFCQAPHIGFEQEERTWHFTQCQAIAEMKTLFQVSHLEDHGFLQYELDVFFDLPILDSYEDDDVDGE